MYYAGYISSSTSSFIISVCYLLYGIILMYFGMKKDWKSFRILAMVIFGFIVLKSYLIDIWQISEIWRVMAFITLGFVILGVGYFYSKRK
jgi:uncharacterized membrane protein